MNNIQRLYMEIKDIELDDNEVCIYLKENGINPYDSYVPTNAQLKRNIYLTALQILESLANNPTLMNSIKIDDMTVSAFYDNLMSRIDQLEKKIRQMNINDNGSSIFLLYN